MTRVRPAAAARRFWRARRGASDGWTFTGTYVAVLAASVVLVPVVRTAWLTFGPAGAVPLHPPAVAAWAAGSAAFAWSVALLVGRKRGPALLPTVPQHALTTSGMRRSQVFGGTVGTAVAAVIAGAAAPAAFVGVALVAADRGTVTSAALLLASSCAAGAIAGVLWLVGQAWPERAEPAAVVFAALAVTSVCVPSLLPIAPWGWVGAPYRTSPDPVASVGALVLLALVLLAATPWLLNRLRGAQLASQAAARDRASAFAGSFDVRGAVAVYDGAPRRGRSLLAVRRPASLAAAFFRSDLIGQVRRPGRSAWAVALCAAASVVLALAALPEMPAVLLAGTAGALVYAGTTLITAGLQHAADVAGDVPIYGISDRRLVLLHLTFPAVLLVGILALAGGAAAVAVGAPVLPVLLSAGLLALAALAFRLSSALKGPMPPVLLSPISSPAGDLAVLVRLGWAVGDPVAAVLAGAALAGLPLTVLPLAAMAVWAVGLLILRWWRRR